MKVIIDGIEYIPTLNHGLTINYGDKNNIDNINHIDNIESAYCRCGKQFKTEKEIADHRKEIKKNKEMEQVILKVPKGQYITVLNSCKCNEFYGKNFNEMYCKDCGQQYNFSINIKPVWTPIKIEIKKNEEQIKQTQSLIDKQQEEINTIFIEQLNSERMKHLEIFSAAYLKFTNLDPKDVVLVEEQVNNSFTWRFEPKSKFNFKENINESDC